MVNGADDKSPRWRHVLLLGGVLLGFEGQNRQGLSVQMRRNVESALVTAAQLALQELGQENDIGSYCTMMVLNYTFELLSDWERGRLDYGRLLPIMVQATFFSNEGLEHAYFLGIIDRDVVEVPDKKFCWPARSTTYQQVKTILARPLISSLGPLSRLIAHSIENVKNPHVVADMVGSISDFSRTLLIQWRQNKLSEVDVSEETEFLDTESLKTTIPNLWQLLRSCLFSMVIILRAVMGRVINDPVLAADKGRGLPIQFGSEAHADKSSRSFYLHSDPAYSSKFMLCVFSSWAKRILAIHVRKPRRYRRTQPVP